MEKTEKLVCKIKPRHMSAWEESKTRDSRETSGKCIKKKNKKKKYRGQCGKARGRGWGGANRLTHSPEFLGCLEAFVVCDGEDAEETLAAAKVVISDGGIILLASRIQYIYLYFLAVQHNLYMIQIRSNWISKTSSERGGRGVYSPFSYSYRPWWARSPRRTHRT